MARRKKRAIRRRVSSPKKAFKRRRKSSSGAGISLKDLAIRGGLGVGRGYLAGWVQPLSSRLGMLGPYATSGAIGISAFALGKFFPKARKITTPLIQGEAYLVGIQAGQNIQKVI